MTSEIRANTLKNRVGLGTISFTNTGSVVSGIVTANTFRLPDATSGSLGRLQIGNGLDLSLFHDGTNSFLVNNTGYLSIQSQDGVNGIFIARNAEVNLYYGSSVRMQTSSAGITVNRDLDVDGHTNLDNVSIAGVSTFSDTVTGTNLILSHTTPTIQLNDSNNNPDYVLQNNNGVFRIRDNTNSADRIVVNTDGHVDIGNLDVTGDLDVDGHTNLDNVSIAGVTTFSGGIYSNSSINLGSELNFTGNGHKYIDVATLNGSNTLTIRHQDGGSYETAAYFDANGGAYLQFNGSTKFATTNTGGTVTGDFVFGANAKAKLFENGGQSGIQATNSGSSAHLMTHDGNEDIHVDPSGYIKFEVAGPERLRIDSSGRILLGSQRTYGNATYYDDITVNNSNNASGASGGTGLTLISGTSSWNGIIFGDTPSNVQNAGYIKYSHGSDYMQFATTGTERLRLHATGYVTKPTNPAFHARPPGSYSISGDQVIGGTWSTSDPESFVRGTLVNGTSIWNNNTGIFTVPVTGIYYIHWSVFLSLNTTRRDAFIYNGNTVIARSEIGTPNGPTGNNKSVSVSTVVSLTVNDEIKFGALTTGGNTIYQTVRPWSYACAYLVG